MVNVELISPAYQSWYNIFLSQQKSIIRLITRKNYQPNNFSEHENDTDFSMEGVKIHFSLSASQFLLG